MVSSPSSTVEKAGLDFELVIWIENGDIDLICPLVGDTLMLAEEGVGERLFLVLIWEILG